MTIIRRLSYFDGSKLKKMIAFLGNDEASFSSFLKLVSHDKKNIKAENRFILPKDFGIAEPMENIPESILRIAYDRMLGF